MLSYNFNRDGALVCKSMPFETETLIHQSSAKDCLTVVRVYPGGRRPYGALIDVKDCLGNTHTYDLCVVPK